MKFLVVAKANRLEFVKMGNKLQFFGVFGYFSTFLLKNRPFPFLEKFRNLKYPCSQLYDKWQLGFQIDVNSSGGLLLCWKKKSADFESFSFIGRFKKVCDSSSGRIKFDVIKPYCRNLPPSWMWFSESPGVVLSAE